MFQCIFVVVLPAPELISNWYSSWPTEHSKPLPRGLTLARMRATAPCSLALKARALPLLSPFSSSLSLSPCSAPLRAEAHVRHGREQSRAAPCSFLLHPLAAPPPPPLWPSTAVGTPLLFRRSPPGRPRCRGRTKHHHGRRAELRSAAAVPCLRSLSSLAEGTTASASFSSPTGDPRPSERPPQQPSHRSRRCVGRRSRGWGSTLHLGPSRGLWRVSVDPPVLPRPSAADGMASYGRSSELRRPPLLKSRQGPPTRIRRSSGS